MANTMSDTIVARATATGAGAVAIVRCSGPLALAAARACFAPFHSRAPQPWRLTPGTWRDPASGEMLDAALCVYMAAPRSYTGEDVVEVHCHGGSAVVESVLQSFLDRGARPAGPGEFTRRAFLNGKMDLAQAEAVADLIQARAARARQVALRQLEGALSNRIEALRQRLIDVIAEMEAYLDFPEEGLPDGDRRRLTDAVAQVGLQIDALIRQGERGRLCREGARVVIAGAPNAGKSSLFNALLGRERALVSPHPGTTRDTIESTIDLRGLAVTLVDTAGLREDGAGEIEKMGIERTAGELRTADLVLWLTDLTEAGGERSAGGGAPPSSQGRQEQPSILVGTKADLLGVGGDGGAVGPARAPVSHQQPVPHQGAGPARAPVPHQQPVPHQPPVFSPAHCDCVVSTQSGAGMQALEDRVWAALMAGAEGMDGGEEDALVSNRRHIAAMKNARLAMNRALEALGRNESDECVVLDLREALTDLSDILGVAVGDAILDAVFSRFCIGK